MANSRRLNFLSCLAPICAVLLHAIGAVTTHAETVSQSVLSYFPKTISELAYADLAKARQFPWFAQFKRQTLPVGFGDLEQSFSSAGMDPNRQIDELVWSLGAETNPGDDAQNARQNDGSQAAAANSAAGTDLGGNASPIPASHGSREARHQLPESDQLLAIALGQFDTDASVALLERKNVATLDWHGHTLYACGAMHHNFYLLFLDSGTVAFGNPTLLEHMLEVRSGTEESVLSNPVLFPLIQKSNGAAIFWGALNDAGTRAVLFQLLPEAANFADAATLIARMKALTVSMDGDDQLDIEFEVSAEPETAVSLSQILQAGLLYRQFQASQEDPQFAKILQNVSIKSGGVGIQVRCEISSDQMLSLIQHNAFSPSL
jgi:hypothetical protein